MLPWERQGLSTAASALGCRADGEAGLLSLCFLAVTTSNLPWNERMSIWLLLVFGIAMVAAVAGQLGVAAVNNVAMPAFVLAMTVFMAGVVTRGIRRPVV